MALYIAAEPFNSLLKHQRQLKDAYSLEGKL